MQKTNNNDLITGYIKQMLHAFNLPKARVINENDKTYKNNYYIKDNNLYVAKENDNLELIDSYIYNHKYLNITKNLKLNSTLYDSYTHQYLGEYLRFLRDYNKLDLMSLYNCFSSDVVTDVDIDIIEKVRDENDVIVEKVIAKFNSEDERFVIYSVPIKFNKKYSVAIDSTFPVEIVTCFYSNNREGFTANIEENAWRESTLQELYNKTYVRRGGLTFRKPFVYDKAESVLSEFEKPELLYSQESNLVMLLKVPAQNKSSIVVLEGDYENALEYTFATQGISEEGTLDNTRSWYVKDDATEEFICIIDRPSDINYYIKKDNVYYRNSEPFVIGDTYYVLETGEYIPIELRTDYVYYDFADAQQTINFNVYNYDKAIKKDGSFNRVYNSRNQLLYVNDGVSYLFADSLIGYLLGLYITPNDEISDNIRRLQKYFLTLRDADGKKVYKDFYVRHYGIYTKELRNMVYDLQHDKGLLNTTFDAMGYVDKNIEKYLGAVVNHDTGLHTV